jgi:hypothetical protein
VDTFGKHGQLLKTSLESFARYQNSNILLKKELHERGLEIAATLVLISKQAVGPGIDSMEKISNYISEKEASRAILSQKLHGNCVAILENSIISARKLKDEIKGQRDAHLAQNKRQEEMNTTMIKESSNNKKLVEKC